MATVQKNNDGTLTVTFRDETVAVFSTPTETHLGLALASLKKDPLGMVDVIVDNCLTTGNKDILKGTVSYCRQLADVMDDLFGKKKAVLEFASGIAYVNFEDGESVALNPCTRAVYSASRTKSASNPMAGMKHIINSCLCSSTSDGLFKHPGYLLGFSEIAEEYLDYIGEQLGN